MEVLCLIVVITRFNEERLDFATFKTSRQKSRNSADQRPAVVGVGVKHVVSAEVVHSLCLFRQRVGRCLQGAIDFVCSFNPLGRLIVISRS